MNCHINFNFLTNSFKVFLLFFLLSLGVKAEEKFTISGYIKDNATGEVLIGGTVFVKELSSGAQANVYGFYSLTLPAGKYNLEYRYIGFVTQKVEIELSKNEQLNIELASENVQLEEIVIRGTPEDKNVTSSEMSTVELDIKTIRKKRGVI